MPSLAWSFVPGSDVDNGDAMSLVSSQSPSTEPSPPFDPSASVVVRVDPSCVQNLNWALVFPALSPEALCLALVEIGFSDRTHVDVVREFESDRRERVIVIPKTGRVQLRLPLDVEKDERPARALAIGQWIWVSARQKRSVAPPA